MEKRYDKLVESVGFLKHPISNVLYRAIAAESTSIQSHVVKFHCEVCTRSYRLLLLHPEGFPGSVHDQIYTIKDQNREPQYYNNGQIIRKHDSFPILVIILNNQISYF
ncbi:hypothetical protein ACTFIT_009402 [Dictyostelium discoideum]